MCFLFIATTSCNHHLSSHSSSTLSFLLSQIFIRLMHLFLASTSCCSSNNTSVISLFPTLLFLFLTIIIRCRNEAQRISCFSALAATQLFDYDVFASCSIYVIARIVVASLILQNHGFQMHVFEFAFDLILQYQRKQQPDGLLS